MGDYSPEKAGVGGSIPSLATIESTTCNPSFSRLRSKTFQNSPKKKSSLLAAARRNSRCLSFFQERKRW